MLRGANAIGKAESDNCSEIVRFYLIIEDNKVKNARFRAYGGATLIAVCSMATEKLIGESIKSLGQFGINDIINELEIDDANKDGCLSLVSQAVADAVANYLKKINN